MGSVVLITEGLVQHHNHYNVLHTVPYLPASGACFYGLSARHLAGSGLLININTRRMLPGRCVRNETGHEEARPAQSNQRV
ncbi:hypothetical protein INR49_022809 [Caranx melampygus]|nr:hypothetical protein INR49_022809 [Caranx melampygus]